MKDKAIKNAMNDIEKIILDVYSHGYNDGIRFSNKVHAYTGDYECGLNDAWECARIMTNLSFEDFNKIFNKNYVVDAIRDYSASEAIAKIKKYEEKQKLAEDDEIKVGDEVIYHDGGAHDGSIGVVLGAENGWREVRFKSCWNCIGVWKDSLTKTGRHFPQIEEVLEQMKGEE